MNQRMKGYKRSRYVFLDLLRISQWKVIIKTEVFNDGRN